MPCASPFNNIVFTLPGEYPGSTQTRIGISIEKT